MYLSNHSKIASTHVYVCAAMVTALSPKLSGAPHAEFVMQVQVINPEAWTVEQMEMIIAQRMFTKRCLLARLHTCALAEDDGRGRINSWVRQLK
jgi:hypothetical protein